MKLVCDGQCAEYQCSTVYFSEADFKKEQIGLEAGEREGGGGLGVCSQIYNILEL